MASAATVPAGPKYDTPFKKLVCALLILFSGSFVYGQQASYSITTCDGVPVNFVQAGALAGTTYTWTAPVYSSGAVSGGTAQATAKSSVQQTLSLTPGSTATATATYQVTPSTGSTFQLVITVTPTPVLSSNTATVSICSGTQFNYTATSATPGTVITWARQQVPGINNNGTTGQVSVSEILNNITTQPIDVKYAFTLNTNGCRNDETITVTVKPTPFLSSTLTPSPICSGSIFSYTPTSIFSNTSFAWQRSSNPQINGGTTANGTGNPNEQLNNTSLVPQVVTYTYTLTNNTTSCVGTQVVQVQVNPVPAVGPQTVTSCSDNSFAVMPNTAPFGTTYTWTAPTVVGSVTGAAAVSSPQDYVHQFLRNTGGATATVTYNVTPSTFGCIGASFLTTVTLTTANTNPTLSSTLTPAAICSGNSFNYNPQSSSAGATFAWQRFYALGITNGQANGTGNISEVLNNGTTVSVPVHYAISTTSGGCVNTEDVTVNVNAATVLASTLTPPAICSNTTFSYTPVSFTAGTAYSWTRATIAGISNSAASGTGDPAEVLVNTTPNPITVTYNYNLLTANTCSNNQQVKVIVNPSPQLTSSLTPPLICSGTRFDYIPTSATTGTVFTWSRALVPSISNGPGAGSNNPSELLVNTSNIPVAVPYTFRLSANNCTADQTVTVTVNPTPQVSFQTATICSGQTVTVTPTNVPAGTVYTWNNPTVSPANSISGQTPEVNGAASITQTLNDQTLNPAFATYTVTPIAATCAGAAFTLSVTVNPVPIIGNTLLPAVCSGNPFSFSPPSVPAGTTYTWSSPVQSPFNSLTGAAAQPLSQSLISQTLSSSNNLSDTAAYSVTPTANGCAGAVFTLTVPVSPVPVVNNVIDTICTGSAFMELPSPVPANTTYTWATPVITPFGAIVGGTAQPVGVSAVSQVLVNATTSPALAVYSVTPTSGSCSGNNFTVTVVVGNALAPFADRTATICSATAFDVTPANVPPNTTYTWNVPTVKPAASVVGLSAQLSPQTTISQKLTNLININDTVVYTIQPYNTGCKGNTFTATIVVLPSPKAVITGNASICRYPVDTLSVAFTGTAPWTFTYTDGNITATRSGITSSPYTWVVPITPNVSSRTLAITGIRDYACNSIDTAYFTQTINPLPVGQIISLHGNYICNNTIDTLYVSSADSLGFQWTYNANPVPGLTTDSIATLTPGSYNAILTNRYGCRDTAAAPVTLYDVKQPIVQFNYDSYCINNIIHFTNLTDTAGIGPTNWQWDFGDGNTASSYNSTDTYLKGGKHHVKLTALQLYCPAYSTSADSTLDIQFPIPAVRMPSVSAYKNQSTPLTARSFTGYKYQWLPSKGIDVPTSATPNFNLQTTQDYIINLISPAGCITPDSMLVRVFDDQLVNIMVPKSFTPNGDGINDVLYPYLAGIKTFRYFRVFNRFGKLLFETSNPDAGWNGTWNGVQQPMAIYVWVAVGIANDGSLVEKRGETLLLR